MAAASANLLNTRGIPIRSKLFCLPRPQGRAFREASASQLGFLGLLTVSDLSQQERRRPVTIRISAISHHAHPCSSSPSSSRVLFITVLQSASSSTSSFAANDNDHDNDTLSTPTIIIVTPQTSGCTTVPCLALSLHPKVWVREAGRHGRIHFIDQETTSTTAAKSRYSLS